MVKRKLRQNKHKNVRSKGKPNKSRTSENNRWIVAAGAAGMVAAIMLAPSRQLQLVYSATPKPEALSYKNIDSGQNIELNIPPGRLADVIEQFTKASGITFRLQSEEMGSISSPGVTGKFRLEDAIKHFLAGTGLSFVFTDQRTVFIFAAAESASVDVRSGEAAEISYSPKFPSSIAQTPQTINIINSEVIRQQGATTLRDVLSNVSGITLTAGEGGAPAGDNLTIRGFSARNDIFIDGARDLGAQSRDPFNLEQVEVFKGPSSSYTGRGSTGGSLNLVSKTPLPRRQLSVNLSGGTSSFRRGTVDYNQPIGDSAAFRVNAVAHKSDFPDREVVSSERFGLAPTLMLGLGSSKRLIASYFTLTQRNVSDYGIPWVPASNNVLTAYRDRPAPVPRSNFYGFVKRDHERLRSDLFTLRVERDFNDNLSIRNQFRYGYSRRDSIATPPRFASNNSTVINREMRSWLVYDDIYDNQFDTVIKFGTAGIKHNLSSGTQYSYEVNRRILRTAANAQTTLFNPNPYDVYSGVINVNPLEPKVHAHSLAFYVLDTIELAKWLQFVGGLRFDRFAVDGNNVVTSGSVSSYSQISRTDKIYSSRAAFVIRPADELSFYLSYSTSANPSLEGLLYSPADQRTPPEKTRNYEIGGKWQVFDNKALISAAVFRVEKTDARTPSLIPGEPPTLDGDQRIDGFELGITGNLTRELRLVGSYTFLDGEIVKSNTAPTLVNGVLISEVGKVPINTPRHSASLWGTYRFGRFFFGAGPRYVGRRFGNNINTRIVEAYTTLDAMASVSLTSKIDFQVNANNLTDKYYFERIGGGHIVPGPGRLVTVTVSFRF
jgi:catecholate siderophore receptor